MHTEQLNAVKRAAMSKGENRKLRSNGFASAVLYGKKLDPVLIKVSIHDFTQIITKSRSKEHSLIELDVEGQTYRCLIRDIQFDPVTDVVEHIDFLNVPEGYITTFKVAVNFIGTPVGVSYGGIFTTMIRELTLRGNPVKAPDVLEIDVSEMEIGGSKHIRDISVEGFEILEEERRTICSVVTPKTSSAALLDEDEEEDGEEEGTAETEQTKEE